MAPIVPQAVGNVITSCHLSNPIRFFLPLLSLCSSFPMEGRVIWGFCLGYFFQLWAFLVAHMVKNLPAMQKTQVQSLGQEDPLEQGITTHSSILAWRIPWTEEPGGLQSWGQQRDMTEQLSTFTFISFNWSTCPSCPSLNLADLPMPTSRLRSGVFSSRKPNRWLRMGPPGLLLLPGLPQVCTSTLPFQPHCCGW